MRKIDLLIVHCAATPATLDIGAKEIRQWHLDKGWSDIGYHFVIRRNGEIELGRKEEKIGSHVAGHNARSLGICMVGGVNRQNDPQNNFTAKQFATLDRLLRILKAKYPQATVHGHNEFSNKACPSFDVQTWARSRNL